MIRDDEMLVLRRSTRASTPNAYRLALRSLRAAEIQNQRIWERNLTVSPDKLDLLAGDVLIDVHFYFISLHHLYRLLRKIVEDAAFSHLIPELDQLNVRWFKHCSDARNAFEHIDERFPGEKYEDRIVEIVENGARRKTQFGLRMSTGDFLHSDKSWDISPAAFQEIAVAVDAFMHRIAEPTAGAV